MSYIIGINRENVFSFDDVQKLFPIVFRITKFYSQQVERLISRLELLQPNEADRDSLEAQVNQLIHDWQAKIQKLGGLPKGLWIADFDSGQGYYCWKYPEPAIEYWHSYIDGFSKRVPVRSNHKAQVSQGKSKKNSAPNESIVLRSSECAE